MRKFIRFSVLLLLLGSTYSVLADGSDADKVTKEAAIGGGVGGALGGAIGAELGDRKGAIIGAAVGAAIGATVATESDATQVKIHPEVVIVPHVEASHHGKGRHCPPGQAKKGRC